MEPVFVGVFVVLLALEGGVGGRVRAGKILPVARAVEIELADVLLNLHHLLVQLSLVDWPVDHNRHVIALQLQLLSVHICHFVVLAGL